ncbi:unnamed protein product [Trifolium pratense]|uniref:Uncharacterized protein n=1 Tax=Trifolium pratense TaxID=57577 RepID=A0ACB0ILM9_TRIPR|nr:unnamed protein product [Trifolium pratense]
MRQGLVDDTIGAKILKTPLIDVVQRDSVIQRFEKNEIYSVLSAYRHCMEDILYIEHHRIASNWQLMWKIKCPPKFGLGGHAYVYLCYGLHIMLNVVADKEGVGSGVLIRSCAPICGLDVIQQRRGQNTDKPILLTALGRLVSLPLLHLSESLRCFLGK